MQPWRFVTARDVCDGFLVKRTDSPLDGDGSASVLALGAAAENLVLAAQSLGFACRLAPFPDQDQTDLVFRAHLRRTPGTRTPPEFGWVTRRVTNRRRGVRRALAPEQVHALAAAAHSRGIGLHVVDDPGSLDRLADVLGRGDRLRFLSATLHDDLVNELRWQPEEVLGNRTGIDMATLELSPVDRAAMQVVRRSDVVARLRATGGGTALEHPARDIIAGTSAVALLTTAATGFRAFFDGGRAVEHFWLVAQSLGLAVQPYTAITYLFRRLGRPGDYTTDERSELTALRQEYLQVFPGAEAATELILLRLAHAGPPAARSLRLPLDQILTLA